MMERNARTPPAAPPAVPHSVPHAVLIAGALALAAAFSSFAWPSDSGEMASSFGSDGEGVWMSGVLIDSDGGYALAAGDGELAYWHEEANDPEALPSGLGSFAVMDQGQDISALYARLKPGSIVKDPVVKKAGDIVGVAGTSGFSRKGNILFCLYDRANGQHVNPLVLLPPRDDPKPPSIRGVWLRDSKGNLSSLAEAAGLKQGRYELVAELSDQAIGWAPTLPAPFSVEVSVNGSERIRAQYDLSKVKDGKRVLFMPADRDYAGFYLGDGRISLGRLELARGKNILEIDVADAGTSPNKKSVRYAFTVY